MATTRITLSGSSPVTKRDDGSFVVTGGTIPMLLSGKGDAVEMMNDAAKVFISGLLSGGVDNALRYLNARGVEFEFIHIGDAAPKPYSHPIAKKWGDIKAPFVGASMKSYDLVLTQ